MRDGAESCYFVIFGATGNLAVHKLLPALYHLDVAGQITPELRFVAISRRDWNLVDWLEYLELSIRESTGDSFDASQFGRFAERFEFIRGDLRDGETYRSLNTAMGSGRAGTNRQYVFYLAVHPDYYRDVISHLNAAGFNRSSGRHRIVMEKPFGVDLESGKSLNIQLHKYFDEDQIYRIDHYLGKETVQNMLVFRFANTLIEPVWNRNYIDHVQITAAETKGIENRASYYDHAGALRDMLQNHLMQLLTIVAMEPPATLDADALRDEKVKVLRSIRPVHREDVNAHSCRARYTEGLIDNEPVPGYLDEPGVDPDSSTETFVAAKFYIDNWRWRDVPFYLRTGKRLGNKMSMIAIRFRHPPQQLFRETPVEHIDTNWILLSMLPMGCMNIELNAKQPGLGMDTRIVPLNAAYHEGQEPSLDAYQALLLDVIEGDRSLFIRYDEVEWAWRVVDPILKSWTQDGDHVPGYAAGSWGPDAAHRLFDSEDHEWRNRF